MEIKSIASDTKREQSLRIVPPVCHGEKLIFRVYDNGAPIGFALLKRVRERRQRPRSLQDMFSPLSFNAYELKMIEVSQNYRQRGVGTDLLQEVIHYCQDWNINYLFGELKGDTHTLRQWYRKHGFTVRNDDKIKLLPTVSC